MVLTLEFTSALTFTTFVHIHQFTSLSARRVQAKHMSAGGAHARTCARECTSALVQLWRARDQCTKSHSQEC